jgi:phosphate transport system substrate-binding protein
LNQDVEKEEIIMESTGRLWSKTMAILGILMSVMILGGCAQEAKIAGGAAPMENVLTKIKQPMERDIGLKLTLITNGPLEALQLLDKGQVDGAAGGIAFDAWMALAQKEGYNIADKSVYKATIIGKDTIKVLTNKNVNVAKLSKDQLKDIFTGKIENWKEVGGPDSNIALIWGTAIPGTNSVFQTQIMDGEPYGKSGLVVSTASSIKESVASTPGAVGLGPVSIVDNTVSAPEIPEVGRPITLLTRGEPSRAVQKMVDYINGDGKKYVIK